MRLAAALSALSLCVPLSVAACNGGQAPDPSANAARTTPAKPAAASTFGQPISVGAPTSLVDIAKAPGNYKGQVIATQGTVTRVCQERGCWMAIKDDSGTGNATVRMHGHSFFVPTTSSGKHARVQGTVLLMKDGRECDDMAAVDAQLEIDATGVELM